MQENDELIVMVLVSVIRKQNDGLLVESVSGRKHKVISEDNFLNLVATA